MSAFSPKSTREKIPYGFNFSNLLRAGESLVTVSFGVAVSSGTDPNPEVMLEGAPVLDMSPIVRQLVVGGVPGNRYTLQCTVDTNRGSRIEEQAIFDVTE